MNDKASSEADKIVASSPAITPPIDVHIKRKKYWLFILYLLPLLIAITGGCLIQAGLRNSCSSLDAGSGGDCAAIAVELVILPVTIIALLIAWVIALAGMIHFIIVYSRTEKADTKKSTIRLMIVLTILVTFCGAPTTIFLIVNSAHF